MPLALFKQLWEWAVERHRADVVRSLMALDLPQAAKAIRESMVEELMAKILGARPTRLQKMGDALDILASLQRTPHANEEWLKALAGRADRCPIHAAAYIAWLEDRCALSKVPVKEGAALFKGYVRFGLARKALETIKAFPGLKAALGFDPRRYLVWHPRAEVSWGSLAWEDGLRRDYRRFLRESAVSNNNSDAIDFL